MGTENCTINIDDTFEIIGNFTSILCIHIELKHDFSNLYYSILHEKNPHTLRKPCTSNIFGTNLKPRSIEDRTARGSVLGGPGVHIWIIWHGISIGP